MKPKILLLIKVPPPITGATMMNKYVYDSELIRKYFKVDSILMSYADKVSDLGVYSFKKLIKYFSYLIILIYKLLFNHYKFIYFQISPVGITFIRDCLFVLIIKLFKIKILYHLHGKGIAKEKKYIIKKLYKYVFNNESIIVLSELLKYDTADVHKGTVYIVPNGIPNSKILNTYKSSNDLLTILFLSNLIVSKGIIDFLDAMAILANNGLKFKSLIVGKEGDLSIGNLNSLIVGKKLEGVVKYLGPKYNSEKEEILKKSDILVFPTYYDYETFGLVILEAMQFGIPVIATREGAIPEIIDDGITGFLVDKNRPDQIAEKIEILIKNPNLREKMGEAGRKKYLENYTLEKFEKNMLNVFNDIINCK